MDFVNPQKRTSFVQLCNKRYCRDLRQSARYKEVMARTKACDRTAEQQSVCKAKQAADTLETTARRARRALRWASSNPPDSDADFILPVPSTGLEAPSDHLTGRRHNAITATVRDLITALPISCVC